MIVKKTTRRQCVGEKRAAAIGKLGDRISRARPRTPRPPRTIGRFAAARRSTASATSPGSGCMRPTFGRLHIAEVS